MTTLANLQRLLLRSLLSSDPAAFLRSELQRDDAEFSADQRAWLLGAGEDGLRLSRFTIRKLRLQRLVAGDRAAAVAMANDAEAFARRFASYEAEQPPRAVFPRDEAQLFRAFDQQRMPDTGDSQ